MSSVDLSILTQTDVDRRAGGNTLSAYKSAASGTGNSGTPSSIQGGVFGAVADTASSGASSSATAAATSSASSGSGAGALAADISLVGGFLFAGLALML